MDSDFFAVNDIDSMRQPIGGIAQHDLLSDHASVQVVDIDNLLTANGGMDAEHAQLSHGTDMFDLEFRGRGSLLLPTESATGGEERLVGLSADEHTLQRHDILLGRNTITAVLLHGFPVAA